MAGEKLGWRSLAWDKLKAKTTKRFLKTRKVHTMPEAEMAKFRKDWAPLFADWIKSINAIGVDGKAAMAYYKSQTTAVDAEVLKQLADNEAAPELALRRTPERRSWTADRAPQPGAFRSGSAAAAPIPGMRNLRKPQSPVVSARENGKMRVGSKARKVSEFKRI